MSLDPNNPKILTSVRTEMEVAAIVSALVAQGVPSTTTGSFTAGFRAEAPWLRQRCCQKRRLESCTTCSSRN